jgi:hypothetical protein
MPSPGMQPERNPSASTKAVYKGKAGDMPNIGAQVTFDSGCSVLIDVGTVEATVTEITVEWNGTQVYDSTTPNAAGQSSISAGSVTAGSSNTLTVKIFYSGWTRPSIYTGTFTARAGTSPSLVLARTQTGGT